jgi:hypothetical protein
MCAPDIEAAAPAPTAPPVLEQLAPKSADSESSTSRKRTGLSRYKIDTSATPASRTTKLGGIPKKTGV